MSLEGKTAAVSGSGNVAIYAIQKAQQLGVKVVTCSDSTGWIYDPEGIDVELLKEVKECVEKAGIPLETAISTITANPAEILSLKGKGKIQEGFDADLCVLDQGLEIQEVIARGKSVYRK